MKKIGLVLFSVFCLIFLAREVRAGCNAPDASSGEWGEWSSYYHYPSGPSTSDPDWSTGTYVSHTGPDAEGTIVITYAQSRTVTITYSECRMIRARTYDCPDGTMTWSQFDERACDNVAQHTTTAPENRTYTETSTIPMTDPNAPGSAPPNYEWVWDVAAGIWKLIKIFG